MITIVNYGMGNLGSIANMLKRIGVKSEITGDPARIAEAERLILPGVGAFDAAVERIDSLGLRAVLDERALRAKIPVLGVCLGMQLLTHRSEEGRRAGLGWVRGEALAFAGRVSPELKVPHMGWNTVKFSEAARLVSDPLPGDESRFYFVHSYFVRCEESADVMITADYGIRFDAGIQRENIYGVQFHPEKSHRYGMQLLASFAKV